MDLKNLWQPLRPFFPRVVVDRLISPSLCLSPAPNLFPFPLPWSLKSIFSVLLLKGFESFVFSKIFPWELPPCSLLHTAGLQVMLTPLEQTMGLLCSLVQTTRDNKCPSSFPGETLRGDCTFRLAQGSSDVSGSVPGEWPSHLRAGAKTVWQEKKRWEPAHLMGWRVVCTKSRASFPLGRTPFSLLLWCVQQCPCETFGEEKVWPGHCFGYPLCWNSVRASLLATAKPKGHACPQVLGGHCPPRHEKPSMRSEVLGGCVGALIQRRLFAAVGKGWPAGTTAPPTVQEHKTISLGSVPVSSLNELWTRASLLPQRPTHILPSPPF